MAKAEKKAVDTMEVIAADVLEVKPATKRVQTKVLFGWTDIPDAHVMEVLDRQSNQSMDPDYVFNKLLVKKMIQWISSKPVKKNMYLAGDSGIGKTSSFLEFAARMGRDAYAISCSGKTRFEDLVGSMQINSNGETVFVDGPLTRAYRNGDIFVANEISRMDAGEQMRLVDVLDERSSLTITQTGEILEAHPNFRFAATGNGGAFGDERGVYAGEKRGSVAFYQRFVMPKITEMTEEQEKGLLLKVAPELGSSIIDHMYKFAVEIRAAFNQGTLMTSLPNRSLVTWAKLSVEYSKFSEFSRGKSAEAIKEALYDSVLNGAPADEASTFNELYTKWFSVS
jgi:cobaltochelatase CobS